MRKSTWPQPESRIFIIRPVTRQGSSPETCFSFLKHFRILYPFIPNTIQINQRLCNNWHCKDLTHKNSKSVTLILRSCTGTGMVLHKILDKALSSHHNWIKSIEGFAKQVAQRATIAHLSPMCQGKSAPNLMQPFPQPNDATHKIWSRLTHWLQRYSSSKVWNFRHSRVINSKMSGLIRPKIELDRDFMPVLVTTWTQYTLD